MNLIARIWLIKRGFAENSVLPALKAVHVYKGRMQSSDGKIVIDVDCPELKDLEFSVNGSKFVKAIEACDGAPDELKVTESNLLVRKGAFRARLPLLPVGYPRTDFEYEKNQWLKIPPIKGILRSLLPFIGIDASRPWCCGALFKAGAIYATNNAVIATTPYEALPIFNLPSFAVTEILGIDEEPTNIAVAENHITLQYRHFLFRSQILPTDWPDMEKLLGAVPDNIPEIQPGLPMAIDKVVDFCPDADFQCIVFNEDSVATTEGDISAAVEGFKLPKGRYRAVVLQSVLAHATHADFSTYPNAVPFKTSDGLRGVFVGVRQ
jgi:hypothetical protein